MSRVTLCKTANNSVFQHAYFPKCSTLLDKLIKCENPSPTLKMLFVLVSVFGPGQVQLQASSNLHHAAAQSPHGLSAVVLSWLVLHISLCLFTPSSLYLLVYLSSFSPPPLSFPCFLSFSLPSPPNSPPPPVPILLYLLLYLFLLKSQSSSFASRPGRAGLLFLGFY